MIQMDHARKARARQTAAPATARDPGSSDAQMR